jgi:hypothetical protein
MDFKEWEQHNLKETLHDLKIPTTDLYKELKPNYGVSKFRYQINGDLPMEPELKKQIEDYLAIDFTPYVWYNTED